MVEIQNPGILHEGIWPLMKKYFLCSGVLSAEIFERLKDELGVLAGEPERRNDNEFVAA
jgi:hypothetical protein